MKRSSSDDEELARQLQEAEGVDFEAYFEAFSKRQKTEDEDSDTDENLFSIDPLGKYAFCCKYCSCPDKKVAQYYDILNNCGNSSGGGNVYLYHRGCCHNDKLRSDDYVSPIETAIRSSFAKSPDKKKLARPISDLAKKYNTARTMETKRNNEDFDVAIDSILETNPEYVSNREYFQERLKSWGKKKLHVLDLFSGIGSSVVVLKRLGLPLNTIVHVEHDPVAQYVCKYNHKDDGIQHVYFDTFEEVFGENNEFDEQKVLDLILKYGPFDLVLAGAPCQNYSEVNAYRKSHQSNGQYLPRVGTLIKLMNDLQEEHTDKKERIFFMSENVVFGKSERIWPFYGQDEHGLCPVRLDAKDFSPMVRNRFIGSIFL